MHVSRLGLTPLKGARHCSLDAVDLAGSGPVGDRVFALVDPVAGRVVRTADHPVLVGAVATWDGTTLSVTEPGGRSLVGVPRLAGRRLEVDYWGRTALLDVVEGPWAAAYTSLLGREVLLARVGRPGEVVYGAAVSVVTTSSLDELARRCGEPVDPARFRATVVVDTGQAPAFVEQAWAGRRLRVGAAEIVLRAPIPRCVVVDRDPVDGSPRPSVLRALAGDGRAGRYRQPTGGLDFGMDAVVTVPGCVEVGATVALTDAPAADRPAVLTGEV